jgi:hypothetical protein
MCAALRRHEASGRGVLVGGLGGGCMQSHSIHIMIAWIEIEHTLVEDWRHLHRLKPRYQQLRSHATSHDAICRNRQHGSLEHGSLDLRLGLHTSAAQAVIATSSSPSSASVAGSRSAALRSGGRCGRSAGTPPGGAPLGCSWRCGKRARSPAQRTPPAAGARRASRSRPRTCPRCVRGRPSRPLSSLRGTARAEQEWVSGAVGVVSVVGGCWRVLG